MPDQRLASSAICLQTVDEYAAWIPIIPLDICLHLNPSQFQVVIMCLNDSCSPLCPGYALNPMRMFPTVPWVCPQPMRMFPTVPWVCPQPMRMFPTVPWVCPQPMRMFPTVPWVCPQPMRMFPTVPLGMPSTHEDVPHCALGMPSTHEDVPHCALGMPSTMRMFPTVPWGQATDELNDFAWKVINDSTALCNDYTPAGYFVASGRTPEHWVIFLESGGGCYSPTTCNARYFNESLRRFKAKSSVLSAGETLSDFVSPLVTSVLTFQNTNYFKNGRLSVQGQGILDDNCTNNPIFCNHTRVIIPYCSSDLWLANSPSVSCNISKDLYDQCYANVQSSCVAIGEMYFKNCFLSSSNQLSFVFRGQAIYRGALQQLLGKGLANSSTVTLVGSSAGGVGVVNHAKWTLQLLRNGTRGANLSVIADSSWFINFQDNVYKLFVGLSSNGSVQSGGVFSIITATDTTSVTCKDTTHGTPCCFSAFCMLSTPEYYPSKDVSTFMLFGLYDVYLLAQSLIGLNISEVGQKNSGAGLAVKLFRRCQMTSTLWGVGNLLGNQAVDISASFASYKDICSGPHCNSMCPETIILGTQLLDIWSPPVHVLLLVLVLGVALFCLLAKASFWLWYLRIDLKQRGYLRGLLNNMEDSNLQFPDCADEHGVSVSCLDLHYSVTVRTTKVKDEKKDDTAPVVLRRLHSEPQGHTDDATKIYGCGKTTLLDLLTGRRTAGNIGGHIFVNGLSIEQIKDWYVANTGYVLQLATPYYEELTSELRQYGDTVVGGASGPGLSGGQVGVPMIEDWLIPKDNHPNHPSAQTGDFHMFNRLVLLTDGKVAYHGVPERAYEVFIKALQAKYWRDAPRLENENPADVIMDVAGNHKLRAIITGYYERSSDPQLVRDAIKKACSNSKSKSREILDTVTNKVQYAIYGAKRVGNHQGGVFNRLAALEARGAKRASFGQMLYLPAIFFAYGVLLVASALFMFPALYLYYQRALEVYAYEHADGVGEGVKLQISLSYSFQLVNHNSYNFAVFGQVLLINLALNQTWVALLIFIICAFPKIAFRLSPIISSVAGFTSGFFVPREAMPPYYSWLFYINPNYYGFSASANILLNNFNTGCVGSVFECFPSSPQYYLKYFNFDDVNPYLHITILLGFTLLYILLATLSNSIRYSNYASNIKRLAHLLTLQHEANSEGSDITNDHSRENSISEDIVLEPVNHETERHGLEDAPSIIEVHKEEEGRQSEPVVAASNGVKMNPKVRWQRVAEKCAKSRPSACEEQTEEELSAERRSLFLREGEGHVVWKPKDKGQQMRLALVVGQVLDMPRTLSERRKNLEKRVQATRAVLRADSKPSMEQHPQSTRRRMTFKDAANKVKTDLHNSEHYHFHDVVSQYVARMHNERKSFDNTASLVTLSAPPERHVRSKATPTRVDETPPTLPLENLSLVGSFPGDPSEGNAIDVGDLSQNSPSKGASQDSLVKQLPSASPVKNRFSGCATLVASTARSRLERSRQQQNREAVKGTYHESWC
eukprot:Em0028g30a